jgi:hypothetical protein
MSHRYSVGAKNHISYALPSPPPSTAILLQAEFLRCEPASAGLLARTPAGSGLDQPQRPDLDRAPPLVELLRQAREHPREHDPGAGPARGPSPSSSRSRVAPARVRRAAGGVNPKPHDELDLAPSPRARARLFVLEPQRQLMQYPRGAEKLPARWVPSCAARARREGEGRVYRAYSTDEQQSQFLRGS